MSDTLWVGDGKHALCGEACALAYEADYMDGDYDDELGRATQCAGFIEEGYAPEDFDPGETCIMCKKEVRGSARLKDGDS